MQTAYITALYDLMARDERVCSLLSDSGTDYDRLLARDFPERCYNFGIAEALQVSAASGMAAMGKIPFVYTTGAFLAYRAYEFIRDDVCLPRRNVKLVGIGMGTGMGQWSTLGPSHHTTEDIAALRALPNLTLLSASTPRQLAAMVSLAVRIPGPVYIRMGMAGESEFYPENYVFRPEVPELILPGEDYVVFSTGTILEEVYEAVQTIRGQGLSVALWDVPTLKPFPGGEILSALDGKIRAFTVEEHSVTGGLGSAVAEVLVASGVRIPLKCFGLRNTFAEGYGTTKEVRQLNGLDSRCLTTKLFAGIKLPNLDLEDPTSQF